MRATVSSNGTFSVKDLPFTNPFWIGDAQAPTAEVILELTTPQMALFEHFFKLSGRVSEGVRVAPVLSSEATVFLGRNTTNEELKSLGTSQPPHKACEASDRVSVAHCPAQRQAKNVTPSGPGADDLAWDSRNAKSLTSKQVSIRGRTKHVYP